MHSLRTWTARSSTTSRRWSSRARTSPGSRRASSASRLRPSLRQLNEVFTRKTNFFSSFCRFRKLSQNKTNLLLKRSKISRISRGSKENAGTRSGRSALDWARSEKQTSAEARVACLLSKKKHYDADEFQLNTENVEM